MTETDSKNAKKRTQWGRPPLPRKEARSKRVVTFVTERELLLLLDLAEQRGDSLSATVHQLLADYLGHRNRS